MKKKNIKSLNLNKKSISTLNQNQQNQIKGASLWYCDSEGLGCILESRCGNGFCTGSSKPVDDTIVAPATGRVCDESIKICV